MCCNESWWPAHKTPDLTWAILTCGRGPLVHLSSQVRELTVPYREGLKDPDQTTNPPAKGTGDGSWDFLKILTLFEFFRLVLLLF